MQEWEAREGLAWRGRSSVHMRTEEGAAQTQALALEAGWGGCGLQASRRVYRSMCLPHVPASSHCLTQRST